MHEHFLDIATKLKPESIVPNIGVVGYPDTVEKVLVTEESVVDFAVTHIETTSCVPISTSCISIGSEVEPKDQSPNSEHKAPSSSSEASFVVNIFGVPSPEIDGTVETCEGEHSVWDATNLGILYSSVDDVLGRGFAKYAETITAMPKPHGSYTPKCTIRFAEELKSSITAARVSTLVEQPIDMDKDAPLQCHVNDKLVGVAVHIDEESYIPFIANIDDERGVLDVESLVVDKSSISSGNDSELLLLLSARLDCLSRDVMLFFKKGQLYALHAFKGGNLQLGVWDVIQSFVGLLPVTTSSDSHVDSKSINLSACCLHFLWIFSLLDMSTADFSLPRIQSLDGNSPIFLASVLQNRFLCSKFLKCLPVWDTSTCYATGLLSEQSLQQFRHWQGQYSEGPGIIHQSLNATVSIFLLFTSGPRTYFRWTAAFLGMDDEAVKAQQHYTSPSLGCTFPCSPILQSSACPSKFSIAGFLTVFNVHYSQTNLLLKVHCTMLVIVVAITKRHPEY